MNLTPHILMELKNKKIIVTGAGGYIGTQLVLALKNIDCMICRISRTPCNLLEIAEAKARIVDFEGTIQDSSLLESIIPESDIIFHLAGQTNLNFAQQNVTDDWNANVFPMQQLLEYCRKIKHCPIIVFSGTATQVGLASMLPVNETIPDLPISIYDLHKLNAEDYLKTYSAQGFVKGVSLRLSNVYGPGSLSVNQNRGIINQMAAKAIAGNELTIYGEGNFIRDYVFISDVINVLLNAVCFIEDLKSQHFFVGTGRGISIADAVESIACIAERLTGRHININHVPLPAELHPIEKRNFIADISALCSKTKWKPSVEFEEGIYKTVKYFYERIEGQICR